MSNNLKCEHWFDIFKGDYVIRDDGVLFLMNWDVQNHANNQSTQIVKCNDYLTFTRKATEETDENGYAVHKAGVDQGKRGRDIIAEKVPANHT